MTTIVLENVERERTSSSRSASLPLFVLLCVGMLLFPFEVAWAADKAKSQETGTSVRPTPPPRSSSSSSRSSSSRSSSKPRPSVTPRSSSSPRTAVTPRSSTPTPYSNSRVRPREDRDPTVPLAKPRVRPRVRVDDGTRVPGQTTQGSGNGGNRPGGSSRRYGDYGYNGYGGYGYGGYGYNHNHHPGCGHYSYGYYGVPYTYYGPYGYNYRYYPHVSVGIGGGVGSGGSGGGGYYNGKEMGALDLDIRPEKAQIFVNGEYVGVADQYDGYPGYLWLEQGTYDIVFYKEGYESISRQYSIYQGAVVDVNDVMISGEAKRPEDLVSKSTVNRDERLRRDRERVAEARRPTGERGGGGVGRLHLRVWPEDAAVYLDGHFLGTGGELSQLSAGLVVEPGGHVLELVRPGYATEETSLEIPSGETINFEIELKRR